MAQVDKIPVHMEILESIVSGEASVASGKEIATYLENVMNDIGDVLQHNPYLCMSVLRGIPSQIKYHLTTQETMASKASDYGDHLKRANDGTEISDTKVQDQTAFINKLSNYLEELDPILEKVVAAHDKWANDLTGIELEGSRYPTSFNKFYTSGKLNKTNTAAGVEMSEAQAKLKARLNLTKRSR